MAAVLAASPPPPPPMFSNGSVSSPLQTTQTYTPSRTSFPEELATSTSHTQSQQQLRPAKNIEAFKSLLPPPVEFVEGSSTGAIALSVAEGKYEPINVGPPLLNGRLSNGSAENDKSKTLPPIQKRRLSIDTNVSSFSLYNLPIDTNWPTGVTVGTGLYNTGNTCFLNSALQCLLHTPPLLRALVNHTKLDPCRVKPAVFCMSCNLRSVMLETFRKGRLAFTPSAITKNLHYIAKHMRRGRQEDSHEFLRYAIDALQKSCLAGQPPKIDHKLAETTWVHKVFGGRLRSRVTCSQCGHNSDTFDSILDLSIDIHRCESLKDALKKFTAIDYLKGADKYKCEKCKRPVNAEKRFSIHDAPVVLTVHLKRFTPLGRKLAHPIRYEERINLQQSMSDGQFGPSYSLYGVICHAGSGPNSGHYYAHVKGADGFWYEMNDESVARLRAAPVGLKSAYILFYIRDKGQSLQAVVNNTHLPHVNGVTTNGMTNGLSKKRKIVTSDGEDEEDKGESASASKSFIGPTLPPGLKVNGVSSSVNSPSQRVERTLNQIHPQTITLKKKIEDVEKEKTKAKSNSLALRKDSAALAALAAYSDDDEDTGEVVDRSQAPPILSSPTSEVQSHVNGDANDSAMALTSPERPPPTTPLTPESSPDRTIPPESFYGRGKTKKIVVRKRKSPESDADENVIIRPSGPSPERSREKDIYMNGHSRQGSVSSSFNPWNRIKGNNNLENESSAMFRPRKLVKKQYTSTRKPFA